MKKKPDLPPVGRFAAKSALIALLLFAGNFSDAFGATFLVKDGEPSSRIVVASDAPRMARLAAEELKEHIQKMSGAEIPIGTERAADGEVSIFVGRSEHTDALKISDEGLRFGAFRMVSGPDYLVLLGKDLDFEPTGMTQEIWEEKTGKDWRNPVQEHLQLNKATGVWENDEGGSLYAVYEFLRNLGVRWYMPGELGEVIPKVTSIELPEVNETVRPDFPVRFWIWSGQRFANAVRDDLLYDRRVGAGARYEVLGSTQLTHGTRNILSSPTLREKHPDYYALIGGVRDNFSKGTGHACFSSAGLQDEVAAYARAVFDHLGVKLVQLSPQDGFRQCECEDCHDQTPSDNVFGFLNRVASDVYQTHPDCLILSAGYTSYKNPPESIDQLSPNLMVTINNMGRPRFVDNARWDSYQNLVKGWQEKMSPGRILRVENTLYGSDPIPAIHPRSIAKDLHAMRGISMGERNELRVNRDLPASTHLNRYVMGRYYWDAEQDIEALLDEYYDKFYGPAAAGMKASFDFAENHPHGQTDPSSKEGWYETQLDIRTNQLKFWEMVQSAREVAGDSVYGQRIDLLLSESPAKTESMHSKLAELRDGGDPRVKAPLVFAADLKAGSTSESHALSDRVTGETPTVKTSFTLEWEDDALIVDILCEEPDMANLQSSKAITLGDNVAILLETPYHAHYHIEINPDGEIYDRVWGASEAESWSSQAIVETSRGEDHWRARVKIPIANIDEGQGDPLHFVVGDRPTQELPWYFNVGRVRVRGEAKETFLFSPTGKGNFHQPAKFARLQVR